MEDYKQTRVNWIERAEGNVKKLAEIIDKIYEEGYLDGLQDNQKEG